METKLFYLILSLIYYIHLIKCTEIFKPTNYTLNDLSTFKHKKILCHINSESVCTTKGTSCDPFEDEAFCILGTFLCLEDENEKCISIDDSAYNVNYEMLNTYYEKLPLKERELILNACDKINVDSNKCKTEVCQKNEDCFSGLCYSNSCITNKPIYVCSDMTVNKNEMGMKCKKQNEMKCNSNSDCYSDTCEESGFCGIRNKKAYEEIKEKKKINEDINKGMGRYFTGIAIAIVIIIIIILLIIICCIKKICCSNPK